MFNRPERYGSIRLNHQVSRSAMHTCCYLLCVSPQWSLVASSEDVAWNWLLSFLQYGVGAASYDVREALLQVIIIFIAASNLCVCLVS